MRLARATFPRRLARSLLVVVALLVSARSSVARGSHRTPIDARASLDEALASGQHAFCTHPPQLLDERELASCPLARETPGCEALAAVCDRQEPKETPVPQKDSKLPEMPKALGTIALVATAALVLLLVLALLVPVVLAFVRDRRDRKLADATPVTPVETRATAAPARAVLTDAERLLALANDLAARGETREALGTYLTASLRALDQRGLIRFARHRTNGEYVRACTDARARAELAAVVREVELSEFGGQEPSRENVGRVATSAAWLVRPALLALSLVLFIAGCGDGEKARVENTPSGRELVLDVLHRQGFSASYLAGSLGAMPIPREDEVAPLVVVDFAATKVDDEARAHLLAWVRAGGVLLALAPSDDMEDTLAVLARYSPLRDVTVLPRDDVDDLDAYPARLASGAMLRRKPRTAPPGAASGATSGAKKSAPSPTPGADPGSDDDDESLSWLPLAYIDAESPYAAAEPLGRGAIVSVATTDLFTNMGIAYGDNANAAVALIESAARSPRGLLARTDKERAILFARPQAGLTPPGNPLSALSQAGLGLGMWHALAASLVLFLAVGARQARARPEAPPARRAFAEHVEATGALYAKARAASHARTVLAKYTDERVRARAPQKLSLDDDPWARLTGKTAAEYKDLLAEGTFDETTELAKMRELRRVLAKISLHSHTQPPHKHPTKKEDST